MPGWSSLTQNLNAVPPAAPDTRLMESETRPPRHPLVPLTRVLLASYWLLLFASTHLPLFLFPAVAAQGNDKLLHCLAYFGLATLWQLAIIAERDLERHDQHRITLWLAGYALFDELSQIPLGRTADPWDWLADMVGVLLSLALFAPVAKWIRQLRWWPPPSSSR